MKQIKMSLLASMIMIFTACGGGSSSSTTSTTVSNTETPQTIAIDKIKAYAADNNQPMPTIEDYLDAGVSGVTVDNIDDMNVVIAGLEAEDVDTVAEIQALANELGVILPENSAPVANAGIDQNVNTTSTVTLDGASSSDADSDTLTYAWNITSKPVGSSATLSSATVVNPTFTADVDGLYVVQLIVNDGSVDSVADTVSITVAAVDIIPTKNINEITDTISAFDIDGNFLYIYTNDQKLNIYDISDHNNILLISSTQFSMYGSPYVSMMIKENYLYIIWDSAGGGLIVYDIINKAFPSIIYSESLGCPQKMSMAENYLYISDGCGQHNILFSIIDPTNITKVGQFSENGIINNNYIYTVDSRIIDINSLEITQKYYESIEYIRNLHINLNYLYLMSSSSLAVFDITTPTEPIKLNKYFINQNILDYKFFNNKYYILTPLGVLIVNVTNPSMIEYIGTLMIEKMNKIYVNEDYIYLSSSSIDAPKFKVYENTFYALEIANSPMEDITISDNQGPIANAGADQMLYYTETINLSASLSTDDSMIVSYTWTEGETVLSNEMNLSTTGFSVGTHILILTVLDDDGATSTDEVVVSIFDDFTNLLPMGESGTKIISSFTINGTTTTTLSAGSQMYFKITNDTNREFTINQFQIISTYNGVDTIRAFSDDITGILGDNKLKANESVSLGHTLSTSETANIWIGIYYLTDDATGETFTNTATWNGTVFR